jgi:hypothetical protein
MYFHKKIILEIRYMYCHKKIILENVLAPTLTICLGNYQDFLNYYNPVGNVPILLSFLLNRTKGQQSQSCVLYRQRA